MAGTRKRLGDILLSRKLVSQEALDGALAEQRAHPRPLGSILVKRGFITERLLLQALAAQIGVSAWHLEEDPPSSGALAVLDRDLCEEYDVLPVRIKGDLLVLAMRNPEDIETIDMVRNLTGLRIEPALAEVKRIHKWIRKCYAHIDPDSGAGSSADSYVKQALAAYREPNLSFERNDKADLDEIDTRPVVGLVNQIVSDAIKKRASDIHIEPMADRIDVRLRVDGELVHSMEVPPSLGPMLTTRMKIMSGIDIVESRVPQDGRITAEFGGRDVDLRVSVLPSYHGPRIVMRILDRAVGLRNLTELGFGEENFALFRNMIERPYGLFLVTGPTGSGKTTTLYAALNELRNGRNNILTCEDPIEYVIDGINQSQVNERVGLTFAKQLRAVLRQDPDIVLVGEIRDQETAETAIRASMTGHLVLSTLHTNDAPAAIPRLLDMGIDPVLLSTSLIGVTSQRLLRVLCPLCKSGAAPDHDESEVLRSVFLADDVREVFRPVGCERCLGTGFRGRMAVHELMPVTAEVSRLIAEHRSVEDIREAAVHYGFRPIQEDALDRIQLGQTSVQEAKRLIAFETIARRDIVRPNRTMAA